MRDFPELLCYSRIFGGPFALLAGALMGSLACTGAKPDHEPQPRPMASPSASLGTQARGSASAAGIAEAGPQREPPLGMAKGASSEGLLRVPSPVVLLAGGDIDLSRRTGQRILREPSLDPFKAIRPLLSSADLRIANLESCLCDLGGVTGSPDNNLVFAGPPGGTEVLARGLFDIVSTANNHAWDYGARCLRETAELVSSKGIAYVGTDAEGLDPYRPQILEKNGQKLAFFAMTGIFNHGALKNHAKAKLHIADADIGLLGRRIAQIRREVDWVILSLHIGEEYSHTPIERTQQVFYEAMEAGVDVVLGHHPHIPQRIDYHQGKPVVFSMGNLVFHENSNEPWTGWGYMTRITFASKGERGDALQVEMCSYHLFDAAPQPLTEQQEKAFLARWDGLSRGPKASVRKEKTGFGCMKMEPQ